MELSGGSLSVTGNVVLGNGGVGTLNRTGGAMTVSGNLTAGGAGTLIVDATDGSVATTFGGTLTRSGTGVLVVVPYTGDLAATESVSFTTNPTLPNGIIGPWAVRQASGTDTTGDYLKTTGSSNTLATADYTSTNFSGSIATSVVTVTSATTLARIRRPMWSGPVR